MKHFRLLEIIAVGCGLAYTGLYLLGSIWCWFFALSGALIFLILCAYKRLFAESALQIFYVGTAVLGYLNWGDSGGQLQSPLPWLYHIGIIASGLGLTLTSGWLLRRLTPAALPHIDSFTTIFSIFATLLMVYFFPENWLYWLVIDAVSVYLYFSRKMYWTAALFSLYTIMAVLGIIDWLSA